MTQLAPRVDTYRTFVPAIAADSEQTISLFQNKYAGSVTAVRILPVATSTANGTNYRTFEVRNEGTDGTGTNKITDPATANNGTSATDLTAQDVRSLTVNPTAAQVLLAAGDLVSVVEATPGTGVAHSGYVIEVDVTRS